MAFNYGNQSKSYLEQLLRLGLNSFKACGYEQITVSGSIKNLTIPTDAKYALLSIESSNTTSIVARYLEFGGSITVVAAGTGMPLYNGMVLELTDFANLSGFQIIEESANTTILNIQYYK